MMSLKQARKSHARATKRYYRVLKYNPNFVGTRDQKRGIVALRAARTSAAHRLTDVVAYRYLNEGKMSEIAYYNFIQGV